MTRLSIKRGKGSEGRRGSSRRRGSMLPRLARWAGVGIFVSCWLLLNCEGSPTEPGYFGSGIVLSNVHNEDGFWILSPKDGSTVFRFSTGGPPINSNLGVFEKYGEIVLEDRASVRAFNTRGEKKWEISYGEGQPVSFLWLEQNGDSFWWWGPEHEGNNLYRFKRVNKDPLMETNCFQPSAGAIHPQGGALWLASEYEKKIVTISTEGRILREVKLDNRPYDIKIDSEGNVWIPFQAILAKYDADFKELFSVRFSDQLNVKRIVIDKKDNSCWAVAGNSTEKFSRTGKKIFYKNGLGRGAGSVVPGVVYEGDQSFWLLNHEANTLRKISKNGEELYKINTDAALIEAFGGE